MSDERAQPAIGIDIGGSRARVALVDGRDVIGERSIETGVDRAADAIIEDVGAAARELIGAGDAATVPIGVGVAGQVDPTSGRIVRAPNLGWVDVPLGERLRERLGRGITVMNDVQAAAVGEWRFGAGQGASDMLAVFVGTGVGGGIISDGRLLRGCGGNAGEIGHTVVDREGPLCACGSRGCIEAYAGGRALAKRGRRLATSRPERAARLLELAGGDAARIDAPLIVEAAAAGDVVGMRLIHDAADALGAGLASLLNTLNPCIIVLGGGVLAGAGMMAKLVEASARARALAAPAARVRFERAELEPFAGVVGAAAWARLGPARAETRAAETL